MCESSCPRHNFILRDTSTDTHRKTETHIHNDTHMHTCKHTRMHKILHKLAFCYILKE